MTCSVRFAPAVLAQLDGIERYIVLAGSPGAAARYVDDLVAFCESLSTFPQRGNKRDDLLPGLRVTTFRGRANIAFRVDTGAATVSILGVFHRGQDYEAAFQDAD